MTPTKLLTFLLALTASTVALGDTPPARVINSLTYDAAGNAVTSTVSGGKRGLDCNVSNALAAPGNQQIIVAGAAVDPRSIRALTTADQVACGQLGSWSILNISGTVSLPTNAAQETGGNLASMVTQTTAINGKMASFDLDSGAGVQNVQGVNLRLAASGGSVEAGTATNPLRFDPTGSTTQPVSTASLPLPAGASTSALQSSGNSSLSSIDGKLNNTTGGALKTDSSAFTQPVSAASLPLPAGAATSSNQTTSNASLGSIDGKLTTTVNGLKVDGSAVTQPISGSVTVTGTVSAAQSGTWAVRNQDGAGNNITSQASGSQRPMDVGINVAGVNVDPRSIRSLTSGGDSISAVQSGTWNVGNVTGTVTLPTGAATAALQTSGNATLTSIDGKVPTNGQKAMAGSLPVVIASDQSPINITGTISASSAAVGAIAGNVPTSADFMGAKDPAGKLQGLLVDTGGSLQTAGEGVAGTPAGGVMSVQGVAGGTAQPVSQSGTFNITNVSGTVSLPTGAATAAKQPALGTSGTPSADVLSVQGTPSMVALKVDGSAVTQPISAAALPLPSGAATASAQTTGNASLSSIDTKTPALVSGRVPVDGSGVTQPVSGTVTANAGTGTFAVSGTVTANIGTSGSLALDTTLAKLTVAQGAATGANTGALVQGVATTAAPTYTTATINPLSLTTAGSLRVDGSGATQPVSGTVTANAGSGTFAVSAAALPLPTGASTSAKQPALGTSGSPSADVISVQGISSMTPLKVDASATTQPVSGTVTVNQGGTWTVQQGATPTAVANAWPFKLTDGTSTTAVKAASTAAAAADPSAVVALSPNSPLPTGTNTVGSIANISGTVSLPTGAATAANQTTANNSLSSIDTKTPALVSGRVPVDGSAVTQPISASSLPLPTGAATSAAQTTMSNSLSSIDGKTPALGQTTQALSSPVVVPGDFTSTTGSLTVQDTGSSVGTQGNNQTIISGTATAGSTFAIPTNSYNSGVAIVTGTWTGSVQVETSSNNGTSWIPLPSHQAGGSIFFLAYTSNVQVRFNIGANTNVRVRAASAMTGTASVQFVLSYNPSGITFVNNAIRITDGANSSVATPLTVLAASTAASASNTSAVVALSPNSPLPTGSNLVGQVQLSDGTNVAAVTSGLAVHTVQDDGYKPTYSAGTTAFATAATATDVFTITGSATKTIRVLKISLSGTTTGGAAATVSIIKRSAADTGGTSAAATVVPMDSNDAAGTATVANYTANPTALGASLGVVRSARWSFPTTTTANFTNEFVFGTTSDKAVVLRGTAQQLAVNLNSTTLTGSSVTAYVVWTEE